MKYTERAPTNKFNDLVLNYWTFEVPKSITKSKSYVHEVMPENTVSIVFINQPYYKGIKILGPQTKKFKQQIFPGSFYLGIRFNAWIKMDNILSDKKSIINKTITSPDFLNTIFKEIEIHSLSRDYSDYHLIEKGLVRLIQNKKIILDPLVKYICLQLKNDIKINELIKKIPLSIRPIQNNFKSITGITMSKYRSIHRLQKAIRMIYLEKNTITDAAIKNNYTDYSHFINTFKKYMETTVKNFLIKEENIELSLK